MAKRVVGARRRGLSIPRGQSLVELALALPVILLILFGIIEFGRAFLIYSEVSNAAREGARLGMVRPEDIAAIVEAARSKVTVIPADQMAITVTYNMEPIFGDLVVVTTTYNLAMVTPLIADFVGPLQIEMVAARTIMGED